MGVFDEKKWVRFGFFESRCWGFSIMLILRKDLLGFLRLVIL
jgi:hypothetical protein